MLPLHLVLIIALLIKNGTNTIWILKPAKAPYIGLILTINLGQIPALYQGLILELNLELVLALYSGQIII